MKFFISGRPMLPKPHHLKSVGLPSVYLLNGVTIEHDADYGDLVTVENMQGLYRAIGLNIIAKASEMTGTEFRFLRKQMALTQRDLAERMSVSDQTIANYEKGKTAPAQAIAHMRLLFLVDVLPPESSARLIKQLSQMMKEHGFELPDVPLHKISEGWQQPRELRRVSG